GSAAGGKKRRLRRLSPADRPRRPRLRHVRARPGAGGQQGGARGVSREPSKNLQGGSSILSFRRGCKKFLVVTSTSTETSSSRATGCWRGRRGRTFFGS